MKIALLGGSFNPVHKGHLKLAESAVILAGYDRVVFVPAYQSPFKQRCSKGAVASSLETAYPCAASDEDRIEMLRLAIKQYPWAELDLCEIERGGVSYTIDTVRFLTKKYTTEGLLLENGHHLLKAENECLKGERGFLEGKLGIIIGADLVAGFPRWKEADALAREADIILARRPDALKENGDFAEQFAYPHISIMNEMHDISSTEIRERIASHGELSELIPDEICRYIKHRGIYDS